MSRNKLVDAFGYIDDKYLDLVETERKRRSPLWFYGGGAAACLAGAVVIFTVGVMAADWFGIRSLLLRGTADGEEGGCVVGEPITTGQNMDQIQEISLSGYWDSPETQALNEWKEFLCTYDQDGSILWANDKEVFTIEGHESYYCVYSQEMVDKLCEIKDKYGLKLHTDMDLVNPGELAYRVGGQFWDSQCRPATGYIYENGTFHFDGDWYGAAGTTLIQFQRMVKGTFEEVTLNIGEADDYREWQYRTKCGEMVMLALGPTKGLIFADFDSCFVTVNILSGTQEGLTEEQVEKLADSFDFTLLKNVQVPDMRGDVVFQEDEDRLTAKADGDHTAAERDPNKDPLMEGPKVPPAEGRYGAYYDILFDLRYNFRWPDRGMVDSSVWEEGDPGQNVFALADVDRDGSEELVIVLGNTFTGGMRCSVYGYDESTGECYEEMTEYPDVTFFNNGIALVGLSHNHGPVCESLWPYSVYQYDDSTGKYELVTTVFGFDRDLAVEYNIENYPYETDRDNYGTVYYFIEDTYLFDTPVDRETYENWYNDLLEGAVALKLEYRMINGWNMLEVNSMP